MSSLSLMDFNGPLVEKTLPPNKNSWPQVVPDLVSNRLNEPSVHQGQHGGAPPWGPQRGAAMGCSGNMGYHVGSQTCWFSVWNPSVWGWCWVHPAFHDFVTQVAPSLGRHLVARKTLGVGAVDPCFLHRIAVCQVILTAELEHLCGSVDKLMIDTDDHCTNTNQLTMIDHNQLNNGSVD